MRIAAVIISILFLLVSFDKESQGQDNYPGTERSTKQEFRVVLAPRYTTTLSAQVSSSVKRIGKEMGDSFDTGEVLISQALRAKDAAVL